MDISKYVPGPTKSARSRGGLPNLIYNSIGPLEFTPQTAPSYTYANVFIIKLFKTSKNEKRDNKKHKNIDCRQVCVYAGVLQGKKCPFPGGMRIASS